MRKSILLATMLVFSMTFAAWAAVPPPPVNQNLGIDDGVFNDLDADGCNVCHGADAVDSPVDPTYTNVDRHHLRVSTPPTLIGDNPTQNPDGAAPCLQADPADPDYDPAFHAGFNICSPADAFECLSCHVLRFDMATMTYEFVEDDFRNCLNCHKQVAGDASVHHLTPTAQAGDCVECHGSLVENGVLDDDSDGIRNAIDNDDLVNPANGWVPDYEPSLVTPWTSGKTNGGANGEGNCDFCHDAGIEGTVPNVINVKTNQTTHHGTGFGSDNTKCLWCHDTDLLPDPGPQFNIRRCENCHGIGSLHNIQVDSPNAANIGTIAPGQEDAYWGHIGAQADCWGCHGNNGVPLSAPGSGPTIPFIESVSVLSVKAGVETPITIKGASFTNGVGQNPTTGEFAMILDCDVRLTDAEDNVITLEPTSQTVDTIEVVLPGYLSAGTYRMAAVKGPKASNPVVVAVTPKPEIFSADCVGGIVTIAGNGLSSYYDAANSGTSVVSGSNVAQINSWTDTEIVAEFRSCVADAVVNTLFGSVSTMVQSDEPVGTVAAPELDRLRRNSGRAGRVNYAYGSEFGTNSQVMIGEVAAPVISCADSKIKFQVPSMSKGRYNVTVVGEDGQVSEKAIRFRVR